jgi:PKD repeat protein
MKKNLFSFLTLMFFACSFVKAQNPSNDCKLKADFAFKPDNCSVAYTDKSTLATGSAITKWYWSFGDGTSDTTKNPTHVYKHSGKYTVCLTVVATNAAGKQCKENKCESVAVKDCGSNNDSTKCRLSAKFDAKVDSCTATFANGSTAANGSTITGWYWSFGDGSVDSTNQNPKHVYTKSGLYNVCLTITGKNAAGEICKDKTCRPVAVKGCAIVIDSAKCKLAAMFKMKTDSCNVSFTDASSAGLGTTIIKRYWSFGDGSVDSVNVNPTHAYDFSGNYNVCLTIVGKSLNGKECKDKECHMVNIKGCAQDTTQCRLNAKFSSKSDSCTVTFTDNSTASAGWSS